MSHNPAASCPRATILRLLIWQPKQSDFKVQPRTPAGRLTYQLAMALTKSPRHEWDWAERVLYWLLDLESTHLKQATRDKSSMGILSGNPDYKHQKPILKNSNQSTNLLAGFWFAHGLDFFKKVREWKEQRKLQVPNTLSSRRNINLAMMVQALLPPNTTSEHYHCH